MPLVEVSLAGSAVCEAEALSKSKLERLETHASCHAGEEAESLIAKNPTPAWQEAETLETSKLIFQFDS